MQTQLNVTLLTHTPEPDKAIALAGRLCYSDSDIISLYEAVGANADKFIQKLLDLGHLSPLEHASFTFGVEGVSRALLAQITRHRIASFSVQSQRYVNQNDCSYILPPSIAALGDEAVAKFESQMKTIANFYSEWAEMGIPKEDARFVLPNAAETRMVFTMNARELLHFFTLRCCNRAQWEIRQLAWAMLGLCRNAAPSIFKNAGPACVFDRCSEGKMSCGKVSLMQGLSEELNTLDFSPEHNAALLGFVKTKV